MCKIAYMHTWNVKRHINKLREVRREKMQVGYAPDIQWTWENLSCNEELAYYELLCSCKYLTFHVCWWSPKAVLPVLLMILISFITGKVYSTAAVEMCSKNDWV